MSAVHPAEPSGERRTLRDRWYAFRDPLLRSARFQRWAAGFPLTRWIARKRAGELFDLVAGFVYSQVLQTVVRLRVLEHVADRPLSLSEIATRIDLDAAGARRLCTAAVALRLLSDRGGRYGLGDLGGALLGNPGVAAMVEHHALFYDDLRDPVALLRGEMDTTRLSSFWAYASTAAPGQLGAEDVAAYSRLMAVSQEFIAAEILDACPLDRHAVLLDVGGGEGAFVRAAAARHDHLRFQLFDLPAVADRARAAFAGADIAARAEAFGGSVFDGGLPRGSDIATLVRVLYDHPREKALSILRAVREALPPGGTLLVAEPMAATPGAETVGAAYFGFYLLAMRGGDARTPDEIIGLVTEAGFRDAAPVATRSPLFTSIVRARV